MLTRRRLFSTADIRRILPLDGGRAKGFYTLRALKVTEALVGAPL
jgi:hypothetical protein